MRIEDIRKGIAVVSTAVVAICIISVACALAVPGAWVEVDGTDSLSVEWSGLGLMLDGTLEVRSNMNYDMDDLDVKVVMTDPSRGSYATVLDLSDLTLYAHDTTSVDVHRSIPVLSMLLMADDVLTVDGKPLEFRISVSCSYLLGLASFSTEAVVEVPMTADGEVLSWDVVMDDTETWTLGADGLADWILPDEDILIAVSGGGESATLSVTADEGLLTVSAHSDSGLDGVFQRISDSECMQVDGATLDRGQVRTIGEVLDVVRRF